MKVLILTRSPWDDTNSIGNTMTNFWSGCQTKDLANIYCRVAKPNNKVCELYYSISEQDLVKSIINPNYVPGTAFKYEYNNHNPEDKNTDVKREDLMYGFFRRRTFVLIQWGRELIWRFGRWKNEGLNQFLLDFKPDIIFAPCFSAIYTHKILWYIQKKTNAKVVLFHADDYLTVKGFGGSLLSKINRRLSSKFVIKSANKADLNYCISPKQLEVYSHELQREMKLLYKGADFSTQPIYEVDNKRELIRIVYVGSILYGRWKTLGMLARTIEKINKYKPTFELLIYSQYKPSIEAEQTMILDGVSRFMGKISADKVQQILKDSDIVLHVESFDKKERIATKLSFSTKIVDCLHSGRCILAIGWKEAASIDYFIKSDSALVATDEKSLMNQLKLIMNNRNTITEYAQKAWAYGTNNHQIEVIQKGLYEDLIKLVKDK